MSRGLEVLVFQEHEPYDSYQQTRPYEEGKPLIREIPILGRVSAGRPTLAVEHVEGTISLPAEWVKGKEAFLLKVKGDSMSPYILPDDYVVVQSQSSAENGDVVVNLDGRGGHGEAVFQKGKEDRIEARQRALGTIQIEEESGEVQILGKVIGVFRKSLKDIAEGSGGAVRKNLIDSSK